MKSAFILFIASLVFTQPALAVQLITDPGFQTGVTTWSAAGAVEGRLQYTIANGTPDWILAQWNTKGTISGVTPSVLASGSFKWQNSYKEVVMGPLNTSDSNLILTLDSISEYGGVFRPNGNTSWPQLLVQQSIGEPVGKIASDVPSIAGLTELNLHLEAQLVFADNRRTAGYDPSIHAAQFVIYFTVQNLAAPGTPGYGDYLWFGLTIYDDRYAVPPLYIAGDPGTGKMIYNMGVVPLSATGLTLGEWKDISGDILPQIKLALAEAWKRGFLPNSQNLADYKIGAMNMGWEVPGLSKVSVQVRNFGLDAQTPALPPPTITSSSSMSAIVGQTATYQITATNLPTSFGFGWLKPCAGAVTFNAQTGVLSITPTVAGTYSFAVFAEGAGQSATLDVTLTVVAPGVTSAGTMSGVVGQTASYQIAANNSPTSYGFGWIVPCGGGASFDASTGLLTVTPSAAGTYSFTVVANGSGGSVSKNVTLTVTAILPAITSLATMSATVGQTASYQVTATNSPTNYDFGWIAPCAGGASFNTSTGLFGVTPSAAGTYSFTVVATNAAGSGTQNVVLSVSAAAAPPVVTSGATLTATVGADG